MSSIARQNKILLETLTSGNHREKIYPYDVVGKLLTCGDEAWGATVITVPVDAVIEDYGWEVGGDTVPYNVVGFSLISVANPAVQCTLNHLRIVKVTEQLLDVDSGFGEVNPDRIYVPATGGFEVDDWVWIHNNDDEGVLSQIEAIDTDNYLDMDGDLVAPKYEMAKDAKVYLAKRVSASGEYESIWNDFSTSTTKALVREIMHSPRCMAAGDGMIARGRSVEAGAPTVRITIIYDDREEG